MRQLEVTQRDSGIFECCEKPVVGTPIAGHGMSVLEAVGEWAIQSQAVQIQCRPPAVIREYRIDTPYNELMYDGANK